MGATGGCSHYLERHSLECQCRYVRLLVCWVGVLVEHLPDHTMYIYDYFVKSQKLQTHFINSILALIHLRKMENEEAVTI